MSENSSNHSQNCLKNNENRFRNDIIYQNMEKKEKKSKICKSDQNYQNINKNSENDQNNNKNSEKDKNNNKNIKKIENNEISRPSIVKILGIKNYACGYCHNKGNGQIYFSCLADLKPHLYEHLSNSGFRRSGINVYKPCHVASCCCCYPIKLDVRDFRLSKSHKKTLKIFKKFLRGDLNHKFCDFEKNEQNEKNLKINFSNSEIFKSIEKLVKNTIKKIFENIFPSSLLNNFLMGRNCFELNIDFKRKEITCNIIKKWIDFLIKNDIDLKFSENHFFCLFENEINKTGIFRATTRKNSTRIIPIDFVQKEEFSILVKKQIEIDAKNKAKNKVKKDKNEFEAKIEYLPANFREEIFQIYALYEKTVHQNNTADRKSFKAFLCQSPVQKTACQKAPDETKNFFGTFHAVLRAAGRIIYVAVLDVLPTGVNSVYLFYNPKFAFLNPGCLSALNEIEFVQRAFRRNGDFFNYSMGFYIHSCPKMRYKESYKPSSVLISDNKNGILNFDWIPLENLQKMLDKKQIFGEFNQNLSKTDEKLTKTDHKTTKIDQKIEENSIKMQKSIFSKANLLFFEDLKGKTLSLGGQIISVEEFYKTGLSSTQLTEEENNYQTFNVFAMFGSIVGGEFLREVDIVI